MARRSDHTRAELRDLILDAARQIIRDDGVAALSARKIAARIGYTVGTLYQIFENMDRLVEEVNSATLRALHQASRAYARPEAAGESLRRLAGSFLDFTRAHPREWDAVITYQFGAAHQWSDDYSEKVDNLLGLISTAVGSFYSEEESDQRREDVMVLWCGLYGVFALNAANRLGGKHPPERMIGALAEMFLAARSGEGG